MSPAIINKFIIAPGNRCIDYVIHYTFSNRQGNSLLYVFEL